MTLHQFATIFNLIAASLVLALSWLTLCQWPIPFFRSWVLAFACSTIVTMFEVAGSFLGYSPALFLGPVTGLGLAIYFHARMAFEIVGRPFPAPTARAVVVTIWGVSLALMTGLGHQAAIVPGVLAYMATLVGLGTVMIRAGRTPDYAGMGWLGGAQILQALWFLSYPAFDGSPYLWVGFGVHALLVLGVGFGMSVFVLHRTLAQVEAQNRVLSQTEHELRVAQAERDKLQTEQIAHLEEMDRLKRDFLNAASHELRTPLTSIVGYAEFLDDRTGGELNAEQDEYVKQIQHGAERLRRIVDDMLDFARMEAGTFSISPHPADVRTLVQDEVASLQPQARHKGIRLEVLMPEQPVMSHVDALRVGQVVLNMVSNALKFTPPGGSVRLLVIEHGAQIRIEVTDTGIGIASEHQARLFEKFYQVDPSSTRKHGGAGLGLAISKALVEAHGGQIGVESLPEVGSTFWFTLPHLPQALPQVGLASS